MGKRDNLGSVTRGRTTRAPTRARACGGRHIETAQVLTLSASAIVMDEAWNSRNYEHRHGSGKASAGDAELGMPLTDEQLRVDIARRGLLQPVRVRLLDEQWHLVFGFRRLRACLQIDPDMPVLCTVQPPSKDEEESEFEASSANLAENLNRRELRCFEIAEKLWAMSQARPDLNQGELARRVGLSTSYCSALLRLKKRSAPVLWDLFCRYGAKFGDGITYKHMLEVIQFETEEDQLNAWEVLVRDAMSDGRRSSRNRKRISAKQLAEWLEQLEELDVSAEFRDGVRHGIGLALGTETWDDESSANRAA